MSPEIPNVKGKSSHSSPHEQNIKRASRLRRLVPKETRWKHFIRYGTFKAVVPADGSPMLLFNHAVENHLEERTDESKKFPQVVRDITSYLQAHPDAPKRLVITKR